MLLEDFINNINEKYADAFGDYKFSVTYDSQGYYLNDKNTFIDVRIPHTQRNKIICINNSSAYIIMINKDNTQQERLFGVYYFNNSLHYYVGSLYHKSFKRKRIKLLYPLYKELININTDIIIESVYNAPKPILETKYVIIKNGKEIISSHFNFEPPFELKSKFVTYDELKYQNDFWFVLDKQKIIEFLEQRYNNFNKKIQQ